MTLNDLESRVRLLAAARHDDLYAQLAEHVAIPTGHGYAPGLDEYRNALATRFTALGARIDLVQGQARPAWLDPPGSPQATPVPPTLVARSPDVSGGRRILIVGHLDTVHDPHGAFNELTLAADGRTAVGPGAVDMKGGIVIAINALEVLAEAGARTSWTFMLTSDEETGSFHSDAILTAEARRHDVGIVLEPALPDGGLALQRSGSGQFMIEVFGRSAHAGREFTRGVSAVVALADIIGRLARLAVPEEGVIVNVGPLQGGRVTNTVPDHAACWGNVRYADEARGTQLAAAIDALATGDGDALPRIEVHRHWNRPAKPATDPVRRLAGAARATAEDLGDTLPFSSTGGVCDGNILQANGLPTLDTLGVRGGNLHRTDEFVEVASLVQRCSLLAVLLLRISTGQGQ